MKRNSASLSPATSASAVRVWVILGAIAIGMAALVTIGPHNWPARAASNRFVATTGSDTGNDCSNPSSPCATIQHAINQSSSGDVINLGPGTYSENVIVNQSVTIQGDPTRGATVNGNTSGPVFSVDFRDTSNSFLTAALRMLTITNGNAVAASNRDGGGIDNGGTL